MKKVPVIIACVVTLAAFQCVRYVTAVPRELRANLAQKRFDGHATPVRPFEAGTLAMPDPVTYAWGHLRCTLPRPLITSAEAMPNLHGVLVKVGGVGCLLRAPARYTTQEHLARLQAKEADPQLVGDEVTFRAAAYAVGEQDVSLWMGPRKARSVRQLLAAKQLLCSFTTQSVEVVHQDTIKGLVLMSRSDSWSFEYYSPDESVGGCCMLMTPSKDERDHNLARSIITAMRLGSNQEELSPEAMAEKIRTDNHLPRDPAATAPSAASKRNESAPASPSTEVEEESPQASVEMLVPEGETETPVAAVWTQSPSQGTRNDPLVVAVWRNGRVLWSADSLAGGAPFFEGRIPAPKVGEFLAAVRSRGYLHDRTLCPGNFGPDSSYTTISITDGKGRLQMESWHELYERNPNLVDTAHGLTSLDGRQRSAVLAAQPAEYRHYRQAWTDIRETLQALVPKEHRPAGELHFKTIYLRADEADGPPSTQPEPPHAK